MVISIIGTWCKHIWHLCICMHATKAGANNSHAIKLAMAVLTCNINSMYTCKSIDLQYSNWSKPRYEAQKERLYNYACGTCLLCKQYDLHAADLTYFGFFLLQVRVNQSKTGSKRKTKNHSITLWMPVVNYVLLHRDMATFRRPLK